MPAQNIVGPQVRKLRVAKDWSQDALAAHLQKAGWDIARGTLAKIEARVRCVSDAELRVLAKVLGARLEDLYPPERSR